MESSGAPRSPLTDTSTYTNNQQSRLGGAGVEDDLCAMPMELSPGSPIAHRKAVPVEPVIELSSDEDSDVIAVESSSGAESADKESLMQLPEVPVRSKSRSLAHFTIPKIIPVLTGATLPVTYSCTNSERVP